MKKIIRIILSPIIYLFVFFGMLVLPMGPLMLGMGLVVNFVGYLMDSKEREEWKMVFAWFYLPYITAKEWIDGKFSI